MKSLKRYPLPITTEKEACALEGVGTFTARRMMRGLLSAAPAPDECTHGSSDSGIRRTNEENIEPSRAPPGGGRQANRNNSSSNSGSHDLSCRTASATGRASKAENSTSDDTSLLRINLRVGNTSSSNTGSDATAVAGRPLSLASNFAALRGDSGVQTPDVTPKRPTSRARREEVDDDDGGGALVASSKAPRFFSGHWEAWLIVDNREHEFMSMQVWMMFLICGTKIWCCREQRVI